MESTLYAIPTNHCNLHCPHCFVKQEPEEFNRAAFLEQLNKFDGNIILFGGEPTLYLDRLFDIVTDNEVNGRCKIGSISTNLMTLTPELLAYYKNIQYVCTSWNPIRFTNEEYKVWLSNLNKFEGTGIHCQILITLTEDLFDYHSMSELLLRSLDWSPKAIEMVRFEHYIGKHLDGYYERADKFLVDIYDHWVSEIPLEWTKDSPWIHMCQQVFTLTPDGQLYNKCPNGLYATKQVPKECLTCDKSSYCIPCVFQEGCSRPNQLYQYLERKE